MRISLFAKSPVRRLAAVWLAAGTIIPAGHAQFGSPSPAPFFSGTAIPAPPQQKKTWLPPDSAIPADAVRAMTELFEDGLADPRGCEYREVELPARELHFGSVIKTHAWVLPGEAGGERFAVAWDGLVYPVISVGKKVDIATDVEAKIANDEELIASARAEQKSRNAQREADAKRLGKPFEPSSWTPSRRSSADSARRRLDATILYQVNIALLLRAGELALAEKAWSQWHGSTKPEKNAIYSAMADDWLWALYDRAVNSHSQADDRLALASARALVPASQAVLARDATYSEKLQYLDALPELVADQERRAKESARTRATETLPPLQGSALVDALIRDLDLVEARQFSQPGGVDLTEDQIVQTLIQQGDTAVEPLLVCLETDRRLTRSVRYWRDFHRSRTILGAREAAYVALANILKMDFFTSNSTSDSLTAHGDKEAVALARTIRAYWEKNRSIPHEERWYLLLADDKSTPAYWMEAASNIVAPADVNQSRSSMFGGAWQDIPNRPPGEMPALRGEVLRAKKDPSVSELLIRRIQTEPSTADKDGVYAHLDNKRNYALALAKWDGRAHLDVLRAFTEELKADLGKANKSFDNGVDSIVRMYKARLAAGDDTALTEYATWLPTISQTKDLGFSTKRLFEIMWEHPADPVIKEAARKLFLTDGSPWVPLIDKTRGSFNHDLVKTPLIGMPEFREAVVRGLQDKSAAGSVNVRGKLLDIQGDGGWSTGTTVGEDPLVPREGDTRPFRVCDIYASRLSEIPGFPKCELYWPDEKKDAAIPEIVAFLQREGEYFRFQPGDDDERSPFEKVWLHLPKLTHPATRDDVEKGRAIFALEGERRVWPLPAFPTEASWTTLKTRPQRGFRMEASGKPTEFLSYDTRGWVFQAEEVLVNGKWERFFGYVGPNTFAKAPAAEIEFPSEYPLHPLTKGFAASVTLPENKAADPSEMAAAVTEGKPLRLAIQLRNCSGLDQPVPGALRLPDGNTPGRLPQGLHFSLGYLADAPRNIYEATPADWQTIPLRKEVTNAPTQPDGPILVPTQSQTLLETDLRQYFDLSKPGTYQLLAKFETPNGPSGSAASSFFKIEKKSD